MIFIVLGVLAVILSVIAIVIVVKSKNDEVQNYYDAAQNILKEERLDKLLKNPYKGAIEQDQGGVKPMVYLKIKDKSKLKYVFCLDREVCIGRDKDSNQVCVNEPIVSANHCKLFSDGVNLFLQDMYSANGVEVKRGLSHFALQGGETMQLFSKDVLKIGTTRISVILFYFDTALM